MKLKRLEQIEKDQRGFTLVEILIVIAILGIISIPITMSIYQVFSISAQSANNLTAIQEVQNASDWLTRDAQMAQTVTITPSNGTLPLQSVEFRRVSWNGVVTEVIYRVENEVNGVGQLNRYVDASPQPMVVMQNMDVAQTKCSKDSILINFQISSSVSGFRSASETRSFTVLRRSSQ